MTLAALRDTQKLDVAAVPTVYELPAAVDVIYAGAMCCLNSSGYVEPAGASAGQSAVIGRCMATVDNSGGSAGDLQVKIEPGQFKYDNNGTSIAFTDGGQLCYAVDDEAVDISNAGGRPVAGTITRVDSDGVVFQTLYHVAGLSGSVGADVQSLHAVVSATTADITLSGEQTLDGILTATSRILVKNQSSAEENGIYVTAAGAWSRALDSDGADEVVPGMLVYVSTGTENGNSWFFCSTDATITVGTTSLTFVEVPALHDLASTANGEGAALIGIEDVAAAFDATDVEGAFAELVATTTGNGASLIGVEDSAGYFTGTEVETALAELGAFKLLKRSVVLTSADLTLGTTGPESVDIGAVLPNTAVVVAVRANLTDAFDNGSGVSLAMEIGHSNDVDAYEDGFDCFTSSGLEGAGWAYATTGPGLGAPAWDGTAIGQCQATFTAGADTLANFTNGSVTVEVIAIDVAA